MSALEPLINLLVLLSTLSIAAERLANVVKLEHPVLRRRNARGSRSAEKERERRIGSRVLLLSVLLAVVVKADLFAILTHLHAPWDTLGWTGHRPASPAELAMSIAGTIVTGLALGFGSKFWHDVLDIVYGARNRLERVGRWTDRRVAGPAGRR
ncbi:MAG TPA: hypothetical protein VNL18_11600 [Gemmatimonadales bacterium]|nr:hypothetical protein [Gemmatimonadales bacterium]